MGLTVKGSAMSARQQHIADVLLGVGNQLGAGSLACEACIFDAIFESSIGENNGWNPTYGGPLGGAQATFGSLGSSSSDAVATAEATSFFQGGRGFQGGGAIALARSSADVAYIGSQVTAATPFDSQGYSTQYLSQGFSFSSAVAEAKAIVAAHGGATIKGSVAGASSGASGTVTATSAQTTYAFSVSGTDNPDEDYWTAINRLAQEVNWYLFSNGEYLYYMDGQEMLAQQPAAYIDRVRDAARFEGNQGTLTYDNCLALDTPIPTPDGWATMGELQVGDMVIGSGGKPARVLGVSDVHHDHDCYRVQLGDGSSIVADDGHLWETTTQSTAVRTTKQIAESLAAGHRVRAVPTLGVPERTILAVERVPSVPVRCIQVDAADHLYLAGTEMTPTHNTSYNYVSDHKRRFRTQRRTKVAIAQSPTEGSFQLVCGIDEILGGDVIVLSGFGLGDGRWIVGEARRSVFDTYTTLTLIPALAPITEAAAVGTTGSSGTTSTSTSTSKGGTGAMIPIGGIAGPVARTLRAARNVIGAGYSQLNHAGAINQSVPQIKQLGTDCSGYVSYLMGPAGLGIWKFAYATPGIPTAPLIQAGAGQQITLHNNPSPGNFGHVWIEILGQYFECAGQIGVHQMDSGEVQSYLATGSYAPLHPAGY